MIIGTIECLERFFLADSLVNVIPREGAVNDCWEMAASLSLHLFLLSLFPLFRCRQLKAELLWNGRRLFKLSRQLSVRRRHPISPTLGEGSSLLKKEEEFLLVLSEETQNQYRRWGKLGGWLAWVRICEREAKAKSIQEFLDSSKAGPNSRTV